MFRVLLFCLLATSAGCAALLDKPRLVILQHPETMEFQNCEVEKLGMKAAFDANDACIEKYQKMGYVIWGER